MLTDVANLKRWCKELRNTHNPFAPFLFCFCFSYTYIFNICITIFVFSSETKSLFVSGFQLNIFWIFSYAELALYKLKLKQEGARRPSSIGQASSQVGRSPLVEEHQAFNVMKWPEGGSVYLKRANVLSGQSHVIETKTDTDHFPTKRK